jgi:hypothetical protein
MFKLIEDPQNQKAMTANFKAPLHVSKGMRQGMHISGKQLVGTLKKDMKAPKSGRTYRVYRGIGGSLLKRSRLHRASSKSEVPAIITGEFRKSIDFAVLGNSRLEFGSGSNGLAQKYAKVLELGSSKMAARKPLGRTVKKLQNQVKTNISKQINKNLKELGFKVKKT